MKANLFKFLILWLTAACFLTLSAAEIQWIQSKGEPVPNQVVVSGVRGLNLTDSFQNQGWQSWLNIYVVTGESLPNEIKPSVLGSYKKSETTITFTPRFPFSKRITYRAEFSRPDSVHSNEIKIHSKWTPKQTNKTPTTELMQIYPSSDSLPENLLKFYLTFSNPMSGGRVYDHIHLFNESNEEVELPFLELGEELWDDTMQRLTLFIDPGRIKRGVKPLEEIGPSLESGKRFRLMIDKDWKDASGIRLKHSFTKEFKVSIADREAINPSQWKFLIPPPDSKAELVIKFGESLDFALAQRMIEIVSPEGQWVRCEKSLQTNETELHFKPNTKWRKGSYAVRIQSILEDIAGNNVGKSFEVDVFNNVQRRIQSKFTERFFTIK
jgi:hypothetical protein